MRLGVIAVLACSALLALAPGAEAGLKGFRSPSGNIVCVAIEGMVRCDILATSNGRPKRPSWCHFDYGYAYGIQRNWSRGQRMCVSDTVNDPSLRKLGYGRSWKMAGVTCRSRTAGVTCTNHTGHGFFLSRGRQTLL